MVEIKGSVVSDAVKTVKSRYGDAAYETIVKQLTGEARRLFEKSFFMAISWYPLDAFVEFLAIDLKVTANGNEEELIRRSEYVIEQELTGIYKTFVKMGSVSFLLKRISAINRTYFRGVDIEVRSSEHNNAVIRFTGFAKRHRLMGFSIIGFYRKALEISGAKDLKAEFTTTFEEDKGFCELAIQWSSR